MLSLTPRGLGPHTPVFSGPTCAPVGHHAAAAPGSDPPGAWGYDHGARRCDVEPHVPRQLPARDGSSGFSSSSPSNSKGVTSAGTNRPRMVLSRRRWLNLFAFAKWRQFHVTRKSHLWYEAIAR